MYRHGHLVPIWKQVSTKTLLEHSRLTLIEDIVILPNGREIDYLRFGEKSEAVMVILQREDGHILLETEYSYPSDQILYQFPCGVFYPPEDPASAALRELGEETQLMAQLQFLCDYLMYHRRTGVKMHVYTGSCPQPDDSGQQPDVTEDIRLHWLTPDEIDELILAGQISNVDILAPWLLYKLKVLNAQ